MQCLVKVGFWWFDFTCSCCLVVKKVKEKRKDWNFKLLWVFFDMVFVRKLKSLLNSTMLTNCSNIDGYTI